MAVYYVLLALILGLGYPLCIKKPGKGKTLVYLGIVFLYMWFLATFRMGIGFDYLAYIRIFNEIKVLPEAQLFTATPYEPGFVLVTKAMSYFVSSSVVMYGIYSALILIPIVIFIYRFCKDPWLSTWLYVTMAFLFTNMSFIRQSLACSVGMFAYEFLLKRKPVPYMIIALLAGSFHKTALILIPIYFLVQIKLTKNIIAIYSGVVFLSFILSPLIVDITTNFIFTEYKNTRFTNGVLGPNFLVLPLMALIVGVSLFHVWKQREVNAGVFLNILILNATFWLFGSLRHMILERFCMYTYAYSIAILPNALRAMMASPETIAERDQLKLELGNQKKSGQQQLAALARLEEKVGDGEKYYLSATIAVLATTFIYMYFGMYVNNFHNVVQYQTVIPWLNDLLPTPVPLGPS